MELPPLSHLNESKNKLPTMRNIIIVSLLFIALTGCNKSKKFQIKNRLIGTWNLSEHTIDGTSQDLTLKKTQLVFKIDGQGDCFSDGDAASGFLKYSYFSYYYLKEAKKLKIRYSTKWVEEFEILAMETIPGIFSYDEPEEAPEQYMKLKIGNEEFKFIKVYVE